MDMFVLYIVLTFLCLASVAKKEKKVYENKTFSESKKVSFM